jgi:hypothetical protein
VSAGVGKRSDASLVYEFVPLAQSPSLVNSSGLNWYMLTGAVETRRYAPRATSDEPGTSPSVA